MGPWVALVNADGSLASVATTDALAPDAGQRFTLVDLGASAPDLSQVAWDGPSQSFVAVTPPALLDRLDDVQTALQADATFVNAWKSLNTTQKQAMLQGIREVLASFALRVRYRRSDEPTRF